MKSSTEQVEFPSSLIHLFMFLSGLVQKLPQFSSMFITLVKVSTSGVRSTSLQSKTLRDVILPNKEPIDHNSIIIPYAVTLILSIEAFHSARMLLRKLMKWTDTKLELL